MPRSGPGAVISKSFNVMQPVSGRISPAMSEIRVVLPEPEKPTIATNSPFSMFRSMSRRTLVLPKLLLTSFNSRNDISMIDGSGGFESALGQAHQSIQYKSHHADGDDAEDDMFVNQRVVLLPQESPHPRPPGQHLGRDDYQPGNAQAEAKAREHVRQSRRNQDFDKSLAGREFQDPRHVQIILRHS